MTRRMTFLLLAVVVLAAGLLAAGRVPAQAQASPSSLGALFDRLNAAGTSLSVRFAAPVGSRADVTLPDGALQLAEVGADYFCFSEPWNDTRRVTCTPFSNVAAVTWVAP